MSYKQIGKRDNIRGLYVCGINSPVNVFPTKRSGNVNVAVNLHYDKSLCPLDVARLNRYISYTDLSKVTDDYMCTETTQRRYLHFSKTVRKQVKFSLPTHYESYPENCMPREKISDPLIRGNNPPYALVTKKYSGPIYVEQYNLHSNDMGLKWIGLITEQDVFDHFYMFSYYSCDNAPVVNGVKAISRFIFSKDEVQSFLYPGTSGYDLIPLDHPVPNPFPLRSMPMFVSEIKGALPTTQCGNGSFHFPGCMMKFDFRDLEKVNWQKCYLPMRENWYSVHYLDNLTPVPCFKDANGIIYFMTDRHAAVIVVMSIGCENNNKYFGGGYKVAWGMKLFAPRENILKYVDSASQSELAVVGPLKRFENIIKGLIVKTGFIEVMSIFSNVFYKREFTVWDYNTGLKIRQKAYLPILMLPLSRRAVMEPDGVMSVATPLLRPVSVVFDDGYVKGTTADLVESFHAHVATNMQVDVLAYEPGHNENVHATFEDLSYSLIDFNLDPEYDRGVFNFAPSPEVKNKSLGYSLSCDEFLGMKFNSFKASKRIDRYVELRSYLMKYQGFLTVNPVVDEDWAVDGAWMPFCLTSPVRNFCVAWVSEWHGVRRLYVSEYRNVDNNYFYKEWDSKELSKVMAHILFGEIPKFSRGQAAGDATNGENCGYEALCDTKCNYSHTLFRAYYSNVYLKKFGKKVGLNDMDFLGWLETLIGDRLFNPSVDYED